MTEPRKFDLSMFVADWHCQFWWQLFKQEILLFASKRIAVDATNISLPYKLVQNKYELCLQFDCFSCFVSQTNFWSSQFHISRDLISPKNILICEILREYFYIEKKYSYKNYLANKIHWSYETIWRLCDTFFSARWNRTHLETISIV